MEKRIMLWIVIGIMFLAVLFMTFKVSSGSATGNVADSGKIDTSGWTENEIMNYEMHGIVPARVGASGTATSSNGMVGGC